MYLFSLWATIFNKVIVIVIVSTTMPSAISATSWAQYGICYQLGEVCS